MRKGKDQSIFNVVCGIISNKKDTNGKMLPITFALIASFIFNMLALFLLVLGIAVVIAIIPLFSKMTWSSFLSYFNNIVILLSTIILAAIILLFALMLRGAANEISKEKSKHYILEVFSSIMSFSALIVALVALIRSW